MPQTNQELIGQIKIPVEDLVQLDASAQSNAMRAWFLDNYEDPVHSLPYSSQEGGYIWLDGGPYDPHDELHAKFGEFVPEAVIQELGDELFAECHEWAAQVDLSDDDVYGFEYIADPAEHLNEYRAAMDGNRALLDIDVPAADQNTFYGMVFVNVVTIMETYLSDTFIGLVPRSESLLRKFVASTPEFKEQKFSLSEIYVSVDKISETAEKYLESVVWHRLGKVKKMYQDTLDVSFPDDIDEIFRAIQMRHALVHKNGKYKGQQAVITKTDVEDLSNKVNDFILSISKQVKQPDAYELLF